MKNVRRGFPSPSFVVSLVALFVALGGTTYAAVTLPANSVGTKQLRDRGVTKAKINKKTLEELKGNRGARGPSGAAIAVRARSSASVDTPPDGSLVSVPLTSNTWTQAATEVDLGAYGTVTYTAPGPSSCGGSGLVDLEADVYVDGNFFAWGSGQSPLDGSTRTFDLQATNYLFEPGRRVTHTVTAKLYSHCGSDPVGPYTGVAITASDVRIDMIRAS